MRTADIVALPDYSELSVEENIKKASVEISALSLAEKMTSERMWEIASLAAAATAAHGEKGGGRVAVTETLTAAAYDAEIGWSESGRDLGTLQKMVACYRKWQDIGRIEGCSFWTHYEYRNKTEGLRPNTSYNEAKADRSPEAAQSLVASALRTVPVEAAVHVAAEFLDTDESEEVLVVDDEASDHVLGAFRRSVSGITRGPTRESEGDPLGLNAMVVLLELSGACIHFRQLANEQPENSLIAAGIDLMHETIRMAKGEEVSPEVATQTISDLEEYLKNLAG